jgi:hypothetical protein
VRSSVKLSDAANNDLNGELIRRTLKVWQPRLGRDLSCEESRQIVENVLGFFALLADWSRSERTVPANDNRISDDSIRTAAKEAALPTEREASDHG